MWTPAVPGHRPTARSASPLAPSAWIGCVVVAAALLLLGCSSSDDATGAGTVPSDFDAERCLVRVHGRSDVGAPPVQRDGFAELAPDANEAFDGGGRVWIYDTDAAFDDARSRVLEVIDAAGCERVVLHGFSNGAAFTAALVCRGETFDGRLRGAVIDDPVPDDSSPDCAVDPSVEVALYWTGGLTEARAGASCSDLGWTCAGGDELIGVEELADRLGVEVNPSVHEDHRPYDDAPEVQEWLGAP